MDISYIQTGKSKNISWYIVSPLSYCYGFEECYVNEMKHYILILTKTPKNASNLVHGYRQTIQPPFLQFRSNVH